MESVKRRKQLYIYREKTLRKYTKLLINVGGYRPYVTTLSVSKNSRCLKHCLTQHCPVAGGGGSLGRIPPAQQSCASFPSSRARPLRQKPALLCFALSTFLFSVSLVTPLKSCHMIRTSAFTRSFLFFLSFLIFFPLGFQGYTHTHYIV